MRDLARDAATKPGFERVDADWLALAARLVRRGPVEPRTSARPTLAI